ncbi:MAG: hypothetical protein IJX67_01755 [Oscillospiraceae bacterium]|nr:hypothetical protein [Oscillospiraceae bacterium]
MDIRQEIQEFVSANDNNGALLLTGKWGCGKSYLVKHLVEEINKQNDFAVAIVSLFGINSVEMLHARVKDEYLELSSGLLGNVARKAYGLIQKIATEGAKITAAAMPESVAASAVSTGVSSIFSLDPLSLVTVKDTIGTGDKERKFAIVFDDFERCGIPKKELLGVINEFSENRKIKTILIADEEKISDSEYLEFKEKLITRTLKLNPDHSSTIHAIIENYAEPDEAYKAFLLENEDCLCGAFFHSKYNNLRTLKACIFDFRRVHKAWKDAGVPMDDIESVFYKFCAMEYEAKAGLYGKAPLVGYKLNTPGETDEERDAANKKISDKYLPDTFNYTIVSLARWIVEGDWDEDRFVTDIRSRYVKVDISHEAKFINYHFWDLQQEDIDQGMPVLVARAYKGEATRDELIALLQKTFALKKHGISLPCEVDYSKIDQGLELRKAKMRNGEIPAGKRRTFTEDSQIEAEAIPLNKKIEAMDEQIYAWSNRQLFIAFLNHEGKISHYDLRNRYIDAFDDMLLALFVRAYNEAENGEKRELCWALTGIDFNHKDYSSLTDKVLSKKNFGLLLAQIEREAATTKDQMAAVIAKSFIPLIEEKIVQFDTPTE